jgi:catechol 2,3-dioxygenase-like lactoylglutathione lyase family enzyme
MSTSITIHASFLPHDDPDASLAFYRDALGFEVRGVVGDAGVGGWRVQDDGRAGLVGGADRDPAHPAVPNVAPDLEA